MRMPSPSRFPGGLSVVLLALSALSCEGPEPASGPSLARGGGKPGGGTSSGTIVELGVGQYSTGAGVNEAGQVVGYGGPGSGGFLWENGVLTDLGTLPGMTWSAAQDINEAGQVTGTSFSTASSLGFLWTRSGGMIPLGTLGGSRSESAAINDNGEIAGTSGLAGDQVYHAVIWRNGVVTDIQAATFSSGVSYAWGINASGQVTGQYQDGGGVQRAFIWSDATGMVLMPEPLSGWDVAIDIADDGSTVGWAPPAGSPDPQAYRRAAGGVLQHLGTLGGRSSVAFASNEVGEIVGRAETGVRRSGAYQFKAFIWTGGSGMKGLPLPQGTDYAQAHDISNAGWVVGEAWASKGIGRAILWKLR